MLVTLRRYEALPNAVAIDTVHAHPQSTELNLVRFIRFDAATLAIYERLLAA